MIIERSSDPVTFDRYIADARKKLQMSQKELASQILREEDDEPISRQYLNDIERGRRNPSSDHLIRQFAKVLKIDADYLSYLAGKLPEEIRRKNLSEDAVKAAFLAFRKAANVQMNDAKSIKHGPRRGQEERG